MYSIKTYVYIRLEPHIIRLFIAFISKILGFCCLKFFVTGKMQNTACGVLHDYVMYAIIHSLRYSYQNYALSFKGQAVFIKISSKSNF